MAFRIHEREHRDRLEVRSKPYFVRVTDGLHLGYRKGKLTSRWVVRRRVGDRYISRTVQGVEPDDRHYADAVHVLSFQQMVEKLMSETKPKLECSFCGKNHKEVNQLVAGPGVFICDACVALCQIYIDHPNQDGKLKVKDGRAVLRGGKPVFVPLSEEERAKRDELRRD